MQAFRLLPLFVFVAAFVMALSQSVENTALQKGQNQRAYPKPQSVTGIGSFVLGNPTDKSIALAIRLNQDANGFVEYQPVGSSQTQKSDSAEYKTAETQQIVLDGLKPNTEYTYRFKYKTKQGGGEETTPEAQFRTQRKSGQGFMFFVQGDSHPERNPKMNVPRLYERTLTMAAAQKPDFFICMGDDFSVDTLRERTPAAVEEVYVKQFPYLGIVGRSAPIYLVNGNHEQAAKANLDGTANSLGVMVQNARNRNYAQPAPDAFYSGNSEPVEHIGLLRNYFAWTWGDALFVVIDPYWHSSVPVDNTVGKGPGSGDKRNRDLWQVTLGKSQYEWLKKTLENSKAKYKFVFAHHVNGTGRGGVELASLYEWGGKSPNGANEFSSRRPGWDLPIHQLFVKTGVDIFFQGHDHIFAKQELDGVIYQSTPVPADVTNKLINGDAYRSGDKVVGAGLVRVNITPEKAKVEFLRAYLPEDEKDGHKHGEVAYSYEITPKSKGEQVR